MDLTPERMKEKYNADLANGLGNLVSRVLKLSERLSEKYIPGPGTALSSKHVEHMKNLELSQALELLFGRMKQANEYMSQEEPWKLAGIDQERFEKVIKVILADLEIIAFSLKPFLPETAEKIQMALREGKTEPLFQRI